MMKLRMIALLAAFAVALAAHAAPTRNNDDSCDIALLPAATLLLPYFEVNRDAVYNNTLITITNVSPQEQIARVTLWTDYSFPVLTFNVYLTGYDVQSISLHDVIWRGVIAPGHGTGAGTGTEISSSTLFSDSNPRLDLSNCASLPGTIPASLTARMQSAFTLGRVASVNDAPACNTVGGVHTSAVGYATIDVVRRCDSGSPATPGYFNDDMLWDNVLVGDYQQINRVSPYSEGNPMIHIRAVSEGGTAIERRSYPGQYEVTFRRTFYSRYQNGGTFDARQPLPSAFVARWVSGTANAFQTTFKIWREGVTTRPGSTCSTWSRQLMPFTEAVVFDEEENPRSIEIYYPIPTPIINVPLLPATSRTNVEDSSLFPRPTNGAGAGWIYLNLDNDIGDNIASQNWVITTMRAEGQLSIDETAFALGNGCSAPNPESEISYGSVPIGPASNINP